MGYGKYGVYRGTLVRGQVERGPASLAPSTSSFLLLSRLELSDTKVYEPYIRALLGTAAHVC